jgi:hypothetical protein
VIGGLLFLLVVGGATFVATRTTGHGNASAGVLWAAVWIALGARIWIRWGWEDFFSIPACFALAVLSLAVGFSWI